MTKKHGETTAADRQSPMQKFRAFFMGNCQFLELYFLQILQAVETHALTRIEK